LRSSDLYRIIFHAKPAKPQSGAKPLLFLRIITSFVFILLFFSTGYTQDTTKQKIRKTKISPLGGIFLSVGGGLSVPLGEFSNSSDVSFGALARIEVSTFSIFPLVLGGEVTYFGYSGNDEFKTLNLLNTLTTEVISFGLTAEYALPRLFKSTYLIPFVAADVKYSMVKRQMAPTSNQPPNLPTEDNKISVGIGAGFTLFIFDFYGKYIYSKNTTNFTVFTKVKFPLIRF
jgi:hypothetical protein